MKCPQCCSGNYSKKKSYVLELQFNNNRKCKECGCVWRPPCPKWGGGLAIIISPLIGLIIIWRFWGLLDVAWYSASFEVEDPYALVINIVVVFAILIGLIASVLLFFYGLSALTGGYASKLKIVNPSKERYSENDINEICIKRSSEDQLLNARTSIVLVFNGLMAVAASLGSAESYISIFFGIVIIGFNFLWIPCAIQHGKYMSALTKIIRNSIFKPKSTEIRIMLQERRLYGPTIFMCYILPIMLFLSWIIWICILITP
jgi:hypothetical protein